MGKWFLTQLDVQDQIELVDVAQLVAIVRLSKVSSNDWYVWQEGWGQWKALSEVAELMSALSGKYTPPRPPGKPTQRKSAKKDISEIPSIVNFSAEEKRPAEPVALKIPNSIPPKSFELPTKDEVVLKVNHEVPKVTHEVPKAKPEPEDEIKLEPPISFQERVEQRKNPRYRMRLKVLIRLNGLVFRTFSRDISLGGIAIENALPAAMHDQICVLYLQDEQTKVGMKMQIKMTSRPGSMFFSFHEAQASDLKTLQTILDTHSTNPGNSGNRTG